MGHGGPTPGLGGGAGRFDSLVSFLDSTERHVELLQTEVGLRTCMRDLRARLAADDALHAEAAFVTEPERDRLRERLVESWA